MSEIKPTKVISIRIPAIYFRRLGYIAIESGKLPSEVAREIITTYLDLGCIDCGGPISDLQVLDGVMALCVNPHCEKIGGANVPTLAVDFSYETNKRRLPGFGATPDN